MQDVKESVLEEEKLKEKARKISVNEGISYSFMDGFGLKYITPFALDIGAKNFHIGLLSSIPSLLGNLSQLFTIHALNKWSRKKVVFAGVLLQSLMWLAMIVVATLYFIFNLNGTYSTWALIVVYTLLITFGAFAGPAWNSWMKDIVPKNRGSYFGRRSKISGLIGIICMLVAGFILDYYEGTYIYLGYVILFTVAFLGRFFSSILFLKQYEPEFKQESKSYFTLFQFLKKMRFNNFGKFTLFFALISFSVAIASPFFAVFMLKNLGFTKINYIIIVLSSAVAGLIFMPSWGRFADKFGGVKTMKLTGFFIPIIPLLWILPTIFSFFNNFIFVYLIIIEIFSGFIWAGFNLAGGNFIYDAVTREKTAICASYFNILNGFGVLIGATLGGFISSLSFEIFTLNAILFVFFLSGLVRLFVYIFFMKKIKEVREVSVFDIAKLSPKKILKAELREVLEPFYFIEKHSVRIFDNFRNPKVFERS